MRSSHLEQRSVGEMTGMYYLHTLHTICSALTLPFSFTSFITPPPPPPPLTGVLCVVYTRVDVVGLGANCVVNPHHT
jgi:hypothetical protein